MLKLLENKEILVVVAHPDDEVLGLGGTMNKLINELHCKIRVVILGEGITSRSESRNSSKWKDELLQHKENIESARKEIGFESVSTYNLPDNRFDSVDLLDIIKIVEKEKFEFEPEIIFTHHGGDLNVDHRLTFEAVVTATRPLQEEKVKVIISHETPSNTEWMASSNPNQFTPNLFVKISESNLNSKIKAMESYQYERRPYPHPRSPKSLKILAERWGVVSGVKYAEAFQIIRILS